MSVNFIMPTSAMSNPQTNPHYRPYDSATSRPQLPTSTNKPRETTSPPSPQNTSPHLVFQSRQIRPPKCPLYVPAVLRPTEPPTPTAGPPTPPSSAGNSYDGKTTPPVHANAGVAPNSTTHDTSDPPKAVRRILADEWNEDLLEEVGGLPTRDHWKPDSCAASCDAPPCTRRFTFLVRRHHCRRCGNVFCATHTLHRVPLDQHARFHPEGHPARACDFCWPDFAAWRAARRRRTQSDAGVPVEPISATPISSNSGEQGRKVSLPGAAASSVPRDWNWSTF